MNYKTFVHKCGRKFRYVYLKLFGRPIGDLVPVSISNARDVAARYRGVSCSVLEEYSEEIPPEPIHLAEDNLTCLRPYRIGIETVLLDIQNSGFSFRNHVLLDPDLNVLFADGFRREEVIIFREHVPANCTYVDGTVAYLSNTWIDNYYHWMQLTLPLIRLYRTMAPEIQIDKYYVGESTLDSIQVETLERLGISEDQIVRYPCRADRMLAAIYYHRPQHDGMRYRDSYSHRFVRSLFVGDDSLQKRAGRKRLYVPRGSASKRKLANESELVAFLTSLGFETVSLEGKSVAEQAEVFSDAGIIVGVHGAALTNLLFAPAGGHFIEIFPAGFMEPGMYTVATYSRLHYYYVSGEPDHSIAGDRNGEESGFIVDIQKVLKILDMAMSHHRPEPVGTNHAF